MFLRKAGEPAEFAVCPFADHIGKKSGLSPVFGFAGQFPSPRLEEEEG